MLLLSRIFFGFAVSSPFYVCLCLSVCVYCAKRRFWLAVITGGGDARVQRFVGAAELPHKSLSYTTVI